MIWILLSIMIVATVFGDLLQSYEMKQSGTQSVGARGLLRLVQQIGSRSYLILGIGCMAISFFAFEALLQRAPMSFAVPASAGTIILETILAKFILREHVGFNRWAGAALVAAGVVMLAR